MAGVLSAYARAVVTLHTSDADQVATLNALAAAGNRRYGMQLLRVDDAGTELEDLTPYLVKVGGSPASITHDSTAEAPGKLTFGISKALQWGFDRVQPVALIAAPSYAGGAWQGFPCGIFVVTSPGRDNLDHDASYAVTGWDRVYLLQSDPQKSLTFAAGSTYLAAVQAVFRDSGALGVSAALSTIATYPGDWASKTLPGPLSFPAGGGDTRVAIINRLLAASGQRPLYTDPTSGRWVIESVPTPATQPLLWRWQASAVPNPPTALGDTGFPDRKIVRYSQQSYAGDVYNAPNRWVFIQSGLSFQPVEGSGQYTVNNTTTPPTDQATVGRIIVKAVTLDASGQTDLKTQGDRIVADDLASFEKITVRTAPWPAAGHYDVFWFIHQALPTSPIRRVQAQQWTLPLEGGPMEWATNVVGAQ